MFESIRYLDLQLFYLLNSGFTNPLMERWMPILTDLHKEPQFLVVVFALTCYWVHSSRDQAIRILAGLVILIACSDTVTGKVIKPAIARKRPPGIEQDIFVRTERFAGYSFPSNHATNNFAGATFLGMFFPGLRILLFAVATFVAYSRVYVGVHYPSDVIAGAIWGTLFAYAYYQIWQKLFLAKFTKIKS